MRVTVKGALPQCSGDRTSPSCNADTVRHGDLEVKYGDDCKKPGMQMVCKMKLRCLLFKCSGQVMHLHSDAIIFHASMFSMWLFGF